MRCRPGSDSERLGATNNLKDTEPMSVYTVHEPPLRAADALADPERFVFVRDGFAVWAFFLTALWMLWHRLWLVLVLYLVVSVGLETALRGRRCVAGADRRWSAFLISFLVGLEAGTLRRFTLGRRGWHNVGVVSGDDLEDAERRFFDALGAPDARPRAAPASCNTTAAARSSGLAAAVRTFRQIHPDVIGLFPEPGA